MNNTNNRSFRWISEKLDGIRAFWNGKMLISRYGKQMTCPPWFTENLPQHFLDGELYMGRGVLSSLLENVKSRDSSWKNVEFVVFDIPSSQELYENRMETLKKLNLPSHVRTIQVERCPSNDDLWNRLRKLGQLGGEGFMLNQPGSKYVGGRVSTLLKVKVI
jgi:DNA ligase-1